MSLSACDPQSMSEYDYDVVDFMLRDLSDSVCDCVHAYGYQRLYDFDVRLSHASTYSGAVFVDMYVYVPQDVKLKIKSSVTDCVNRHEFSLDLMKENPDTFEIHVTSFAKSRRA